MTAAGFVVGGALLLGAAITAGFLVGLWLNVDRLVVRRLREDYGIGADQRPPRLPERAGAGRR